MASVEFELKSFLQEYFSFTTWNIVLLPVQFVLLFSSKARTFFFDGLHWFLSLKESPVRHWRKKKPIWKVHCTIINNVSRRGSREGGSLAPVVGRSSDAAGLSVAPPLGGHRRHGTCNRIANISAVARGKLRWNQRGDPRVPFCAVCACPTACCHCLTYCKAQKVKGLHSFPSRV